MPNPDAPGWYDDPDDAEQLRYFDGIVWSERRVPKKIERPAPPPAASAGHAASAPGPSWSRPTTGQPSSPGPGPEQYGHQSYAPVTDQPATSDGQPLAPLGLRVAAYLIDTLCLLALNVVFAGWAFYLFIKPYLDFVLEAVEANDPDRAEGLTPEELMALYDWQWGIVYTGIALLVTVIYSTVLVGLRGGGVGKLALGLRVRRTNLPGPPGLRVAFVRVLPIAGMTLVSFIPVIGLLAVVVWVGNLLLPFVDPRRQSLQDKVAATQVVQERR